MYAKYIYVKIDPIISFHEYAFPYLVYAIDIEEMCSFTPQDWNFSWLPTEKFKEVSLKEFKDISKKLKTVTTHFRIPETYE